MTVDTDSSCIGEKGLVTRSSTETLSKKVASSTSASPNRKSERFEKRSPRSPGGVIDPKRKMETSSPLRRSERTRSASPSDPSGSRSSGSGTRQKKYCTGKQLLFEASEVGDDEDEERGVEASSRPRTRRVTEHCHVKTNGMNRSTEEGDDEGGSKIDGCLKGNCLDSANDDMDIELPEDATGKEMRAEPKLSEPVKELSDYDVTVNPSVPSNIASCELSGSPEKVRFDSCKEERSPISGSRDFISNENLIGKRIEHDKDEKSISSKRKKTMVAMHSDASTLLVDNDNNSYLFEDTRPSRICSNVVETSGSCSKRIRQISLSDVKKDQRKSIDNVDQSPSKISTRNKKDSERPQMNTVETYKIRKQQRSLHLLLKPEIANLCEILHLPDNVKSMVQDCLEYTMNNYQICTEPLPILQAFQLSLCLTIAALLNHKLNFEASLLLAKQHLNFDCKKEIVEEINSRLWDLKESFLSLKGNPNVAGCAKASESSSGVYSYIEVIPEDELVKVDNSINIKTVQKRKSQWNKLLLMQREERIKLKKDIENENAEIQRRHQIEWEAIRSCSPNDLTKDGKLQASKSAYMKRTRELNRQQEIRLKDLEVKQLKARVMFQESSEPYELLNPIASNKLGTMVKSLQICDQAQHHNAPKVLVSDHVAEGKGSNDTVEVKARIESGVGLSEAPDANASVVAPFSSTVELQTRLVKHADGEMDIVSSKDGLVSEIKCSNIVENVYESHGNAISKHSKSREQRSDGAIRVPDGEECVNFNHESHNDSRQDAVIQVLASYNEDICHGETLDVLSAEVAPSGCNTSSSENDLVEIPSSRQMEPNGTTQIKPVCGSSIEVDGNGSNDGAKNMALLNSQSSEEHIPSVNTMCTPYCENTAQIHDADNNYGSKNADTMNSSLYDERISSWNSKSPQDRVHNENGKHTLDCENFALDGSGSDNFILNSPLVDERNADRTIILHRDAHVGIREAVNLTSSTEQISGGAVNDSVFDSVLSKPYGEDSSSNNSSDANSILSNQTSIEKQNHDGVSSSIPIRQIPVEVSETNERAIVNVLDGEEANWMPDAVNYPDNVIPHNSSSMDQLVNVGPVCDGSLSSKTCTTSPSNSKALPDEHVSVLMPENSLGEVEFQLTNNVVIDKSATLDQQEGVCTTMTENSSYQETPVSRPVDFMESLEQVPSLSFVESPPDLDTSRETRNYVVSTVVDVVQANQSINDSLVMEPPQEGQFPSVGFFSSNWDLSNFPLVTRTEDQPHNEDDLLDHVPGTLIEIQNQSLVQHPTNSDQQEGVCRTMNGNSLSQETPVSLSVEDLMEPLEEVRPLSSLESPPDQNTTIEMQNSLASSSVDTVPANVSTDNSLVMEPPEKEDQLPSASILSSNDGDLSILPTVTGTENQPSIEKNFRNHIPETSIEIQDHNGVQCASNVELDPASNMDLVSQELAGVRQQSSNTRDQSTLAEINNHPIQPASQSDSSIIQRLALDPFKCEMTRLHQLAEDNKKDFEERKLKLRQDFEKELRELYRKFDIKHKGNEVEVQKVRKDLDKQHNIVNINMKLAEACRVKSMDFTLSGAPSMHKDASSVQQLFQVASPQNATAPNVVARPSSREYSAASLQSSYATTTSQTTVPPIQAMYSTPGTFSVTSSRLPRINPLSSLLANVQTGGEIRAPAPHLHPYRTTTSVPASTFCTVLRGRPSQPAPGNIPVTSPPFSYQTPWPALATLPSVLHGGLWPPTLPASNPHTDPNSQHGIYLPNVRPDMPDLPTMNLSKCDKSSITPATSAHPATSSDVVCLSDDE
ncbi:uncharacterized protein HKW66_Vig0142010 [Vigna angularis]|uniref:MOM1 alpha-helical domain-containing protein n=2 Tax=Phaseolus angularis TaxID=3914 RepID=A0A8T0KGL3_PHAAN|nr:helicase protein MOM1 [Vigna angularis]KAG2397563.1 uncharacterized protein HKW66_Vig0142010 [Vigna angularis]BAT90548.1 hypothetical protein VIGAN_06180900 [Vigna angularis var. angularis]